MSRENVELVSEGLDAFNRRDLDRYLATISPDVEWDVSEGFLGVQDVYRGWAGVRKWWNDFLEAWESFDAEIDEMAEGKAGAVFVGINGKGRGRASGVETELHFLFVFWVADHKVARLRMFQNRSEALEAAGLEQQAMSQENVEIVRRAVEAYEREGLDGSLRYYAPEIEWTATPAAIERDTYRGHDGLRRLFGNFDDEFDDLRFDVEELIDAGDQVIVTIRIGGRGRASGASVDRTWSFVCSLRDGMIYRVRAYNERAEALEAAGLSE